MSKWISVKDRLPEVTGEAQYCLCWTSGNQLLLCDWMNIGGWCWERVHAERITHWMPTPEGPEVEP